MNVSLSPGHHIPMRRGLLSSGLHIQVRGGSGLANEVERSGDNFKRKTLRTSHCRYLSGHCPCPNVCAERWKNTMRAYRPPALARQQRGGRECSALREQRQRWRHLRTGTPRVLLCQRSEQLRCGVAGFACLQMHWCVVCKARMTQQGRCRLLTHCLRITCRCAHTKTQEPARDATTTDNSTASSAGAPDTPTTTSSSSSNAGDTAAAGPQQQPPQQPTPRWPQRRLGGTLPGQTGTPPRLRGRTPMPPSITRQPQAPVRRTPLPPPPRRWAASSSSSGGGASDPVRQVSAAVAADSTSFTSRFVSGELLGPSAMDATAAAAAGAAASPPGSSSGHPNQQQRTPQPAAAAAAATDWLDAWQPMSTGSTTTGAPPRQPESPAAGREGPPSPPLPAPRLTQPSVSAAAALDADALSSSRSNTRGSPSTSSGGSGGPMRLGTTVLGSASSGDSAATTNASEARRTAEWRQQLQPPPVAPWDLVDIGEQRDWEAAYSSPSAFPPSATPGTTSSGGGGGGGSGGGFGIGSSSSPPGIASPGRLPSVPLPYRQGGIPPPAPQQQQQWAPTAPPQPPMRPSTGNATAGAAAPPAQQQPGGGSGTGWQGGAAGRQQQQQVGTGWQYPSPFKFPRSQPQQQQPLPPPPHYQQPLPPPQPHPYPPPQQQWQQLFQPPPPQWGSYPPPSIPPSQYQWPRRTGPLTLNPNREQRIARLKPLCCNVEDHAVLKQLLRDRHTDAYNEWVRALDGMRTLRVSLDRFTTSGPYKAFFFDLETDGLSEWRWGWWMGGVKVGVV